MLLDISKLDRRSRVVLFVSALFLLNGCGGGSSSSTPPPTHQSAPLTITSGNPPSGAVATVYGTSASGFALTASGGTAPYTWTWAAAAGSVLPPGLNISGAVISGSPTTAGTFNVTVTVSDAAAPAAHASASYTITVVASGLAITSGAPSAGQVGSLFGQTHIVATPRGPIPVTFFRLTASGGSGAYTWNWTPDAGSSLPPGLNCCQAILGGVPPFGHGILYKGLIIGVPTAPGDYHVTITVMDNSVPLLSASADYTISISPPPPPVVNSTPSPAIGTLNSPYVGFTFSATNGLAPLSWSETGALPPGLALASGGVLSGIPTAAGTYPISVQAMDSAGQTSVPQDFSIQILAQGFKPVGSMATARALHTASLLQNGKVLVVGGANDNGEVTSSELFDATAKTFSPSGNLATARHGHTATVLTEGRVLVTGGINTNNLSAAEIFDPGTGMFSATGSMVNARAFHAATLLQNGKVLVTGGLDAGGVPTASAELYDPVAATFATLPNMGASRAYHTTTLLTNGKVLIAGGLTDTGDLLATAEIFDPAAGTFTAAGILSAVRFQHTATRLNNGTVLLVGGGSASGTTNTAEIFDPAAGTFAATGAMEIARNLHAAAILSDGRVLILGGQDANSIPTSSAELFDPVSKTFARTADLSAARSSHTATLLNTGQVLVTGGFDSNGHALITAELYH